MALSILGATATSLGFFGAGACAGGAEAIRQATYGPSFQYIDDDRLHDGMWRLAKGVQDLDITLQAETEISDEDRQTRVLAILDEMATAAGSVSAPGQATNHKNLELHINKLQLDIELARSAAETGDFGAARTLPNTCLACHKGKGGGAQQP
jgi:hypothetical protein